MDPLDWVREQGVVLQSARGPLPSLAEEIAGEPIRGSWWGHPSGHEVFAVLGRLLASSDVVATATGAHRTVEVPFPEWVPAEELAAAELLTVDEALAQLPTSLR